MATTDTPRRSFFVHQAAEYLIGIALVASGVQSPSPAVPAVLGGVVILNAALVDGPLGAFRAVGRRVHRLLDIVVLLLLIAGVLWPGVDSATRILVLGLGVVMAFLVVKTNYDEAPRRAKSTSASSSEASRPEPRPASRGEHVGRTAGRLTALGVRGAKKGVEGVKRGAEEAKKHFE